MRLRHPGFALVLAALLAGAAGHGGAQPAASAKDEVDLLLVLSVDISYSMDPDEQKLQREGYIQALQSEEVLSAIRQGLLGRIAISYVEWANFHDRHTVIDWRIIDGPKAAQDFGSDLAAKPYRRSYRTSVSGGIQSGIEQLERAPFAAKRRVIDVSGDGANNDGPPVEMARDDALAKGIVINGLPLVLKRPNQWTLDIENLDDYYQDCVVGGPGSFSIPVRSTGEFLSATRKKLLMEIADSAPRTFRFASPYLVRVSRDKTDCLIGEKMWRSRRRDWQ